MFDDANTIPGHVTRTSRRYKVMELEKGLFSVMDMQPPVGQPWNPLMQYDDRESADAYAAQCEFHWWYQMVPAGMKWTYQNGLGGYAWVKVI